MRSRSGASADLNHPMDEAVLPSGWPDKQQVRAHSRKTLLTLHPVL